jgi:LPXTG-motif cell wall-anchored protein
MRISYRAICLLAALILAAPIVTAPAAALAQSAGDEQYVDPFKDDQSGKGDNGGGGGSGSQSDSGSDNSASQGTTDGSSDTGATAGTTAAQNDDPNSKLPRTGGGVNEGWIVAVGVLLLLGGGFALRRVWPRPD